MEGVPRLGLPRIALLVGVSAPLAPVHGLPLVGVDSSIAALRTGVPILLRVKFLSPRHNDSVGSTVVTDDDALPLSLSLLLCFSAV